uniref:NADH-ubiquinone oxidoreductase chain 6 n=1 Tax=Neotrogla sp. 5 KY-2017 TaxID=2051645 RepID=A0A343QCB9_9NEOP|nr:NADH dehydrogenase subunit 6 [Neotrogla sp. 5 KY-2017]
MKITILFSLTLSMLFLILNHPLSMGLTLIIQIINMAMLMSFWSKTFWFLYILIMIFIGGLLILFVYVISIASNELFKINFTKSIFMLMWLMSISSPIMFLDNNLFLNPPNLNSTSFLSEITLFSNSSSETIKLFIWPTNLLTIMLISYLFLTLLIIVKISNNSLGPLRKLF